MAHVFIVDEKTLALHLKYKFAGTGAKDYQCNYLWDNDAEVKPSIERLLTGMVADISRVKPNDKIIFYLQQNANHEGMFFGSFSVEGNPFLCCDEYLNKELNKNLTFRVLLKADEVYSQGITERECLDSLKGINRPSDMCWSLIYRKLKGNRGCTMITDFEYDSIMKKIKKKNAGITLNSSNYTYDSESNLIVSDENSYLYKGKKESLDIKNRMLFKKKKNNSYESHLQAYILQNIYEIEQLKVASDPITWIGNEVSCGVGMQSIDVCFIQENQSVANIVICELKDEQPIEYIKNQIMKYIDWMKDYIVPTYTKKVVIHPMIVAPTPKEKTKELFNLIKEAPKEFNDNLEVKEIRYISFKEEDKNIIFEEVM